MTDEEWDKELVKTLWHRLWKTPEAVGALLGIGVVVFGVLLALLIRDLSLTAKTCSGSSFELMVCGFSIQKAQARLPWDIVGLIISGGLVGAGIFRWRRKRENEK